MLYFDTEFYRRAKQRGGKDETDWKAKCFELFNNPDKFTTPSQKKTMKLFRSLCLNNADITAKIYKYIYQALVGGDPKQRSYRSIIKRIGIERANRK